MKQEITFNTRAACITLLVIALLQGCADPYIYDSENPEAYRKHWENNQEIKDNEFLYQLSEECKENNTKSGSKKEMCL